MMTAETKAALRRLGISQRDWTMMGESDRTAALIARIQRDGQKRQWRLEMPDEPFRRPEDTEEPVVWAQKTFGKESERGEPMPPVYTYVAHKVGPNMWLMGRVNFPASVMTWPQVWEFLALREPRPPVIYRAVAWEVLS